MRFIIEQEFIVSELPCCTYLAVLIEQEFIVSELPCCTCVKAMRGNIRMLSFAKYVLYY